MRRPELRVLFAFVAVGLAVFVACPAPVAAQPDAGVPAPTGPRDAPDAGVDVAPAPEAAPDVAPVPDVAPAPEGVPVPEAAPGAEGTEPAEDTDGGEEAPSHGGLDEAADAEPLPEGFVVEDEEEGEDEAAPRVRYLLEDVRVEGDTRTQRELLRDFVPFDRGDVIDPESDDLESIAWALRGTGWFSRVRIRLERGEQRGWVDLVLEVDDQNTVTVQNFTVGVSEGLSNTRDRRTDALPYVGFSISDSNVLGRGRAITVTGLMSEKQQAARFGFQSPQVFGSGLTLRLTTSMHNGREFYGHQPFVSATCGDDAPPGCLEELEARNVVVFYRRSSSSLGVGRTIGTSVHWAIDWVADVLYVTSMPEAASEVRGRSIVPIDFAVADGRSLASSLRVSLSYDRRDEPNLTRRGVLVRAQAEVGSRLFGSRYDWSRLQATVRGYVPIRDKHVLRFSAFLGVITGDAPFYTLFHVSDLTDLIPSRVLEMDIDRRPAPNLLGNSIGIMRAEEFAGRADVQYEVSLQRGRPRAALRGVNAFANVGVYVLSDLRELALPAPGYHGFDRIPVDLTFDLGLRIDTDIGLFELGFSNLLGFIDLR